MTALDARGPRPRPQVSTTTTCRTQRRTQRLNRGMTTLAITPTNLDPRRHDVDPHPEGGRHCNPTTRRNRQVQCRLLARPHAYPGGRIRRDSKKLDLGIRAIRLTQVRHDQVIATLTADPMHSDQSRTLRPDRVHPSCPTVAGLPMRIPDPDPRQQHRSQRNPKLHAPSVRVAAALFVDPSTVLACSDPSISEAQ